MTAPNTGTTPSGVPSEANSVAELGLDRSIMRELALKTLFYRGRLTRTELADDLRVSGAVMEELMQALTQEGLSTVLGAGGTGPAGYVYSLTAKGLDRAERALARSGYVGPAPVPLAVYIDQVRRQTVAATELTRDEMHEALGPLVLADQTLSRIGRAASSRKPTLIYGASGNGKTTVVRTIGAAVEGTIRIPYAIEAVGHIIHLFDPSRHELVPDLPPAQDSTLLRQRPDRRWVTIHRPVIWAGGELTRHSLELVYDDDTKVYQAPLQLKANGGTLIIDDFGRQQMSAVALLNRWIVALEGGIDHLTMHTGQTIEVPFDVLVLFSTNLPPEQLADEAFLRRIRYKVEIPNPTRDEYRDIFKRECEQHALPYEDGPVTYLLERWYDDHRREMRGCHPRDLVEAIVDGCKYEGRPLALTREAVDEACHTYFPRHTIQS